MKRPKSVKVLNIDYSIEWTGEDWRNQTSSHGQQSYERQRLIIQKGSPQVEADTLLHEIMHAVADAMSLTDGATEEEFVSRMATGVLTVWRDNPILIKWISRNNVLPSPD